MMATTVDIPAMMEQLAREIAEQEATQRYKGYTVADLRVVFDQVCDPQDWKGPIAVSMPGEAVLQTVAAIEFFTATTARVTLNTATMRYLVESEGYRQGPAGDH